MITAILLLLISLLSLYLGTGWLIRGTSSIASRLRIPTLIIGMTIIAFGTSIPELFISLRTNLHGLGDLAMGTVVGSNIYNICIILGIAALKSPLATRNKLDKLDTPVMIAASFFLCYSLWDGHIGRMQGISFLSAFVIYVFLRINLSMRQAKKVEIIREPPHKYDFVLWIKDFMFIGCGILVLIFSTGLLIDNSLIMAEGMGISQSSFALTVIAAGSSLPELATSFIAAKEKDPELAIGNVIGSNIFNALCVVGICASASPVNAPGIEHIDLVVMTGVSVLMLPLAFTKLKINRIEGGGLILIYTTYAVALLLGIF